MKERLILGACLFCLSIVFQAVDVRLLLVSRRFEPIQPLNYVRAAGTKNNGDNDNKFFDCLILKQEVL